MIVLFQPSLGAPPSSLTASGPDEWLYKRADVSPDKADEWRKGVTVGAFLASTNAAPFTHAFQNVAWRFFSELFIPRRGFHSNHVSSKD